MIRRVVRMIVSRSRNRVLRAAGPVAAARPRRRRLLRRLRRR